MEKIILYSDMDGVLTNFDAQFERATNMTPEAFMKKEQKHLPYKESKDNFWKAVSKVSNFWTDMIPMPEMEMYWTGIMEMNPTILTAVPNGSEGDRAEIGKREWIAKKLGSHVPVIVVRLSDADHNISVKDKFAKGPQCILIDDNYNYVKTWRTAGGNAVLFKNATQALKDFRRMIPWMTSESTTRLNSNAKTVSLATFLHH